MYIPTNDKRVIFVFVKIYMWDKDTAAPKVVDIQLGDDAGFLSWLGIDLVDEKETPLKEKTEKKIDPVSEEKEVYSKEDIVPTMKEAKVIRREDTPPVKKKKKDTSRQDVDDLIKKKSQTEESAYSGIWSNRKKGSSGAKRWGGWRWGAGERVKMKREMMKRKK